MCNETKVEAAQKTSQSLENQWLAGQVTSPLEVSEGKNWFCKGFPSNTSAVRWQLANLVFSVFAWNLANNASFHPQVTWEDKYLSVNNVHSARLRPGAEGGDGKPNQSETDGGRAEETLKTVTVQVILPSVTTSYNISESLGIRPRPRGESIPSELSASVLDSLSSLFQVKWEAADKPNEALWKETVSKTAGFALDWMSCARRLIWHLAEVPQLTKHVTQPVRMKAGNVEKLSADGHLGCSSAKTVLLLKIHWKTQSQRTFMFSAAGARPSCLWGRGGWGVTTWTSGQFIAETQRDKQLVCTRSRSHLQLVLNVLDVF